MVQKLNKQGICGTCIYQSDCLYLKNNIKERKTILYCEEFDDAESRKEWENLYSPNSFAIDPCLSVKSLIPGWGLSGEF